MKRALLTCAVLLSSLCAAGYTPPDADELERLDRTAAALSAAAEGRRQDFDSPEANENESKARVAAAQELAETGDSQRALRELLSLYDDPATDSFTRTVTVPRALASVGLKYRPALDALRARREAAKAR